MTNCNTMMRINAPSDWNKLHGSSMPSDEWFQNNLSDKLVTYLQCKKLEDYVLILIKFHIALI